MYLVRSKRSALWARSARRKSEGASNWSLKLWKHQSISSQLGISCPAFVQTWVKLSFATTLLERYKRWSFIRLTFGGSASSSSHCSQGSGARHRSRSLSHFRVCGCHLHGIASLRREIKEDTKGDRRHCRRSRRNYTPIVQVDVPACCRTLSGWFPIRYSHRAASATLMGMFVFLVSPFPTIQSLKSLLVRLSVQITMRFTKKILLLMYDHPDCFLILKLRPTLVGG